MQRKDLKQLDRGELLEVIQEQSEEVRRLEERLQTHDESSEENLSEMTRGQRFRYYFQKIRKAFSVIVVVAAVCVLVANLWLPVLRIYGTSMRPTLQDGQLVLCVKQSNFKRGDVIAFYYNNKILIKRVIGLPGDTINMDRNGVVYRNDEKLEEPYILSPAFGECNTVFPYTVPEKRFFVMGDARSDSLDSRSKEIGCISEDRIIGKLIFKLLPIGNIHKTIILSRR